MRFRAWPIKLDTDADPPECIHCAAFRTGSGPAEENALERMIRWWNRARALQLFGLDDCSEHFTEDAVIVVNGELRARGLDALASYLGRVGMETSEVCIIFPLEETFVSGESIFGHYRRQSVSEGSTLLEDVMASVKTRNGRISFFNAVSCPLV